MKSLDNPETRKKIQFSFNTHNLIKRKHMDIVEKNDETFT